MVDCEPGLDGIGGNGNYNYVILSYLDRVSVIILFYREDRKKAFFYLEFRLELPILFDTC